jgi:hypothetical protein
MSSLLKDLQKMVEDVVWVFGGFGRQSAHINGCVSSTSQQFSMKFSMGCTFRYLWLSSYVFLVVGCGDLVCRKLEAVFT